MPVFYFKITTIHFPCTFILYFNLQLFNQCFWLEIFFKIKRIKHPQSRPKSRPRPVSYQAGSGSDKYGSCTSSMLYNESPSPTGCRTEDTPQRERDRNLQRWASTAHPRRPRYSFCYQYQRWVIICEIYLDPIISSFLPFDL